jgi:hypothetical protein
MATFTASENDFYRAQWPALQLDGWEETGARSYGHIYWHKFIPSAPNMTARLCFIVAPTYSKITLEVRHRYHGMATATIGDGAMNGASVMTGAIAAMPDLIAQVTAQHERWLTEIMPEATP